MTWGRGVPRVVFFGMDSEFSTRPLLALLQSGVQVRAVVKPVGGVALRRTNLATRVPSLMTRMKESFDRLWYGLPPPQTRAFPGQPVAEDPFAIAEAWKIPCYVVGDASGERALRFLRRADADLFCIAFFNQLLRPACLALPKLGAMNLHPSLLPAYRGPSPLFWTFKDAVHETGVTLHMLSAGEDDGDVLMQTVLPVRDGMRGQELVAEMALHGAKMMTQGVWDVFHGIASRRPQDGSQAFRSPRPQGENLRVDFNRPARDVFNFVRGVGTWVPLYAELGEDRVDVLDAQEFHVGERVPGEFVVSGQSLVAQCNDGTVVLHIRPRVWPFASLAAARPTVEGP